MRPITHRLDDFALIGARDGFRVLRRVDKVEFGEFVSAAVVNVAQTAGETFFNYTIGTAEKLGDRIAGGQVGADRDNQEAEYRRTDRKGIHRYQQQFESATATDALLTSPPSSPI